MEIEAKIAIKSEKSSWKKINLKEFHFYFLNADKYKERRKHMEEILTDLKVQFTRVEGPSISTVGIINGAINTALTIEKALRDSDAKGKFSPFVFFEDDVSISSGVKEEDWTVEIPEKANGLFIGLSGGGCGSGTSENGKYDGGKLYKYRVSDRLFRIGNLLSNHGVVFLTADYARAFQRACYEAAYTGIVWDCFTSRLESIYCVYALQEPLVYQDEKYGGNQMGTKTSWKNDKSSVTDEEFQKWEKENISPYQCTGEWYEKTVSGRFCLGT